MIANGVITERHQLELKDYIDIVNDDKYFVWKDKLNTFDSLIKAVRYKDTKEQIALYFAHPNIKLENAEYFVFDEENYKICYDIGTNKYMVIPLRPSTSVG